MLRKLFYLSVIIVICFSFYRQILNQAQIYVDQHAQEPWAPKIQLYIGNVYAFARDYDLAEKTYLLLKKRFPKSIYAAQGQFMIARLYEAKEDYPRARAEFEKFVKDYPEDGFVKKAKEKLQILSLFNTSE